MFKLHPQLAKDTYSIGEFSLCWIGLMNDSQFPWIIAVPKRDAMLDQHELSHADRHQLCDESTAISQIMMQQFKGHKMNIAALGNIVPQLHLHHIVRAPNDIAWPKPVWGVHPAKPYDPDAAATLIDTLQALFEDSPLEFTPC